MKEIIDWGNAKLRFTYSSSDPSEAKPTPLDSNKDKQYYTVGDGMIRIWTKDADKARSKEPVEDADGNAGGDFIPGKKAQPEGASGGEDKGYEFLANKLFTGTEENGVIKPVDLFIEGIGKGTTSGLIKVEFSPKGDNTWMPDEVKVTVVGIDMVVDSDNDGNITDADNPIEELSPGMLVALNDSGAIIDKKNMRPMILRKLVPSGLTGWEVYLTQTGGEGKVRIFRDNKARTVVQPTDNLANELKSSDLKMLVEGVESGEVELQAEYKYQTSESATS